MAKHKNKVSLVGWYGGDLTHAQAAWYSTQTELLHPERAAIHMQAATMNDLDEGRKQRLPGLLKMLAGDEEKRKGKIEELFDKLLDLNETHGTELRTQIWHEIEAYKHEPDHGTPTERSLLHFQATVDTATHIQFLKHRHFSINGESARYKEYTKDKFHLPEDLPWRFQGDLQEEIYHLYERYHAWIQDLQDDGIPRKRAKEAARYFLPYAIQVNLDFSCNFRAFVHFQRLRNSERAQLEIREIAQEMLRLVKEETNDSFKYSLEAWRL